jgi:hypothetical protein
MNVNVSLILRRHLVANPKVVGELAQLLQKIV